MFIERCREWFNRWLTDAEEEQGQGLVEYALILIFVAVVMIVVVTILSPGLGNIYSNIVANL